MYAKAESIHISMSTALTYGPVEALLARVSAEVLVRAELELKVAFVVSCDFHRYVDDFT
jgi:hypothetical protein